MTLDLAKILAKDGIVLNAVAPGETATEILLSDGGRSLH